MGITRKSLFGFPPAPNQGSQYTQREVPLSQGARYDQPWPVLAPGSATSISNYWPLDGALVPRSRLSSLNTIRTLADIRAMVPLYRADGLHGLIWLSSSTIHGLLQSNGSISRASFVSAYGLGVAGIGTGTRWQYAYAFSGTLNENMIVASSWPSATTLQVLYQTGGSASGAPLYSYLSSAPRAACVGAFDNYVIAFNVVSGTAAPTRVQWCVRGSPSDWTNEGSGFEDLLDMRGNGTRVIGTTDQRILLFTELETWQGIGAAFPAQFVFQPLDRSVGCLAPATVVDTEVGVIFLGSDNALRVFPHGGGPSQVISAPVSQLLRSYPMSTQNRSWGVYDPVKKLYHFYADPTFAGTLRGFVLNVVTGEWAFTDHNSPTPDCGTPFTAPQLSTFGPGRMFFGDSTGTVNSYNSTLNNENGAALPTRWRSGPIAADLPGNYKQLTQIDIDYRATSTATLNLQVSQDGGNTYGNTINTITLPPSIAGRATTQVYAGGAMPTINIGSVSTGYEIHRIDVTMALGGRRSG